MQKLLHALSQLLFPNLCVCCDSYLSYQEGLLCDMCLYTLPKFENFKDKNNPVAKKFWGRLNTHFVTAYLNFKADPDVRKILHQLKYKGNKQIGIEMGEHMGRKLQLIEDLKSVDLIIPVPLHTKRQQFRGYNQCDLIVQGITNITEHRVAYDAVLREKYNSTQTKKNRYERFINSKEIFRVSKPQLLEHKHILLVDDVITTGATIEACGAALLEVEGLKLSIATLAVAT